MIRVVYKKYPVAKRQLNVSAIRPRAGNKRNIPKLLMISTNRSDTFVLHPFTIQFSNAAAGNSA